MALVEREPLALPAGNKIATKIFQLNFVPPQNVVQQISSMLTQGSGQALAFDANARHLPRDKAHATLIAQGAHLGNDLRRRL